MNRIRYHIIASTLIATANLFGMKLVDSQKICADLLYDEGAQLRNLVAREQRGECCPKFREAQDTLHQVFAFPENERMRVPEDFDKSTLEQLCYSEKTFFFLKNIMQKPSKAKDLIIKINNYDHYPTQMQRADCLASCCQLLKDNRYIANDHGSYDRYADRIITPLHYIFLQVADWALSEESCKTFFKPLKYHGANINARDDAGNTPLHYAPSPDLIDLLCLNGADPSIAGDLGRIPLLNFIRLENWPVVKRLLVYSSVKDINKQDDEGNTPLREAFRLGNKEIIKLLLNNGTGELSY